jgi:hypothetical protein
MADPKIANNKTVQRSINFIVLLSNLDNIIINTIYQHNDQLTLSYSYPIWIILLSMQYTGTTIN